MGLKNDVSGIGLQKLEVAYSPPALYNAGANIIFVIRGGPVLIMALFAHTIQAMGAGSTFTMTVSGAPVDSGAIVVTSAINTLIVSPLDPTLLWPIVPNVAVSAGAVLGRLEIGQWRDAVRQCVGLDGQIRRRRQGMDRPLGHEPAADFLAIDMNHRAAQPQDGQFQVRRLGRIGDAEPRPQTEQRRLGRALIPVNAE